MSQTICLGVERYLAMQDYMSEMLSLPATLTSTWCVSFSDKNHG